ncbi:hypothetical protein N8J89_04525 [Crossiella sp. CA-258035]|uniref:hypothetical protein n=1 Tax=Crossiella sp. CA-258035 TaxID=2981138 RepID=UPI0024BBF048|nr:hypothetical protein [Crossiella sp. CA-258035]WHT20342.1 hypothetical protein N8J89_04525 [Crossiella sp. CA-258035]
MLSSPVWRGVAPFAFAGGLLLGGVLSAFGVLLLGSVLRPLVPPLLVSALVCAWLAVLVAREFALLHFPLPQNARLVPETVFRHGPVFGPLQFGLEMGTGVRTYVTSGLPYALLPLIAFLAGPGSALLAGLAFGAGRAVMTFGVLRHGPPGAWDAAWLRHPRLLAALLCLAFALAQASVIVGP